MNESKSMDANCGIDKDVRDFCAVRGENERANHSKEREYIYCQNDTFEPVLSDKGCLQNSNAF